MKRTDLVNYLNGVWPGLIIMFGIKNWVLEGVAMYPFFKDGWQHVLASFFIGAFSAVPQILFNWAQSGHPWSNDVGEIKRAFYGSMCVVSALFLFPEIGDWAWITGLALIPVTLYLWDWRKVVNKIVSIFKKKK